jgi:hypothetical protein
MVFFDSLGAMVDSCRSSSYLHGILTLRLHFLAQMIVDVVPNGIPTLPSHLLQSSHQEPVPTIPSPRLAKKE